MHSSAEVRIRTTRKKLHSKDSCMLTQGPQLSLCWEADLRSAIQCRHSSLQSQSLHASHTLDPRSRPWVSNASRGLHHSPERTPRT